MAYNPYGGQGAPPYGPPPSFGSFPGAASAPGMAPPPGLGPPPGMSSAPGMAPPPGVQQSNAATQANRPSGLPSAFQPPTSLPNINFNAPVIRLGAAGLPAKPALSAAPGRKDLDAPSSGPGRPGLGHDRNIEQARASLRESMMNTAPPTHDEKLRTIFIHKIPVGVGGDEGMEKLLNSVGKLRRWDSGKSHLSDHKGELFGFAQFEDPESLAVAVELLKELDVPVKKQEPKKATVDGEDKADEEIEKTKLEVAVDPNTEKFLEAFQEGRGDEAQTEAKARLESAKYTLDSLVQALFYPKARNARGDGDVATGESNNTSGENVEVLNIPLAQEDELADIPAEMREVVTQEIAAFRERSTRRDLERLRREEEMEEQERQRNGLPRVSRLDSPPPGSWPSGPRGVPNAPSGPRGANGSGRGVAFVNGGVNGEYREEDDPDVDDEELHQREVAKQNAEEEKLYQEAERKWVNRERHRAAALDREKDRDKAETDSFARRRDEQAEREKNWDDEKEASRKVHAYYRDHAGWARQRTQDRSDEASRDQADRRAEAEERRRHEAQMVNARGMADSFLEKQAREMEQAQPAAAAPQRFTISFGAAAQKAQAQRAPGRRTVAEVEGLLDTEEQEEGAKRQLIPIKFEPISGAASMTEEEISKAVRALAQEIPTEKEGLWRWEVKWDYMDDSIIADKLRPFVEKKVVEYLGVQEQFLVEVVEEHLRKHGKPTELVDDLSEALDDAAEDMVKKLWRMVIFFTESEKRGLPA